MNSAAFRRIVWKEGRAQFSLWLALVIGAFLLQMTLLLTQGRHIQGLAFVAATAFILTACFIVASQAMLFAGEQEDGTRDWLRQLPVRPITLVASKLTFVVIAVTSFFVAAWCTGMVATFLAGSSPTDLFKTDQTTYAQSLLGAFAWGLLFSVRCRRVLTALLCTVLAEIVLVRVTDDILSQILAEMAGQRSLGGPIQSLLYFTITGLVLVTAIVLAVRWARVDAGVATASAGNRQRRLLTLPWADRREHVWLRLAAFAAERGSPAARETAVLIWREARAAVPFAVVWFLVGLLTTGVLSMNEWSERFQFFRMHSLQPLYLIVTPAVCGILTCLGDQRRQMFRFLGERGAAPARVWLVKQAVWLTAAVVLAAAGLRWQASAAEILERGWPQETGLLMEFMKSVHVPGQELLTGQQHVDTPEDWALRRELFGSLLVGLFAAGQCASLWIRRSILAVGIMLIVVPVLVGWHVLLVFMDVPLWLGAWPLTLALLAATLGSAGAWLRGRDSWTLRFTHLAAVTLPAIAVLTAAAAHRAYAVPAPVFPPDVDKSIFIRSQTFDLYDPQWSERWRAVLRDFTFGDSYVQAQAIPEDRKADVFRSLLELAEQIPGSHGRLDPLVYGPDSKVLVPLIANFLANPTADGSDQPQVSLAISIDDQWNAYVAGLKITAYLSHQCTVAEHYQECLRARVPLLNAIEIWAARADQTPESLQRAFEFLAHDLHAPLLAREMAVNRYAFYEQLLEHRGRKWTEIEKQMERVGAFIPQNSALSGAVMPAFERERSLRLLGHATAEFLSPSGSLLRSEQLARWTATAGGLPLNIPVELRLGAMANLPANPYTLDGAFQQSRARQAGIALVVALQRHRLMHGEFPVILSTVIPRDHAKVLIDAYSNAPFGYEPRGLPADLHLADGHIIPAGQPLLWSAGATRGRITEVIAPLRLETGRVIYAGEYVAAGLTAMQSRGAVTDPLMCDRIRFINVGVPY